MHYENATTRNAAITVGQKSGKTLALYTKIQPKIPNLSRVSWFRCLSDALLSHLKLMVVLWK